jgi:hypothetical protein
VCLLYVLLALFTLLWGLLYIGAASAAVLESNVGAVFVVRSCIQSWVHNT